MYFLKNKKGKRNGFTINSFIVFNLFGAEYSDRKMYLILDKIYNSDMKNDAVHAVGGPKEENGLKPSYIRNKNPCGIH